MAQVPYSAHWGGAAGVNGRLDVSSTWICSLKLGLGSGFSSWVDRAFQTEASPVASSDSHRDAPAGTAALASRIKMVPVRILPSAHMQSIFLLASCVSFSTQRVGN